MRRGFEAAGCECVFTSEWNKFARQTYRANYDLAVDGHPLEGDIRHVHAEDVPEHDLLAAGFPCQPFSIAGVSKKNALGKKHGFACETQGTLFFDIVRIVEKRRPSAFLLENVKNLVRHDGGRTFEVIRRTLEDELGYHVTYRVIDAKGFVPQHRERIFMAGFAEDRGFDLADVAIPQASMGPRLETVLHPEDGSEPQDDPFTDKHGRVSAKYTLGDHLWEYLQAYAEKHRQRGNGFGFGLVGPDDVARTISARYYKDGAEVLVRQQGRNPRRLTPRECSRIMGFDAPTRADFKIPVSDTQAYRQFGNAVVVPVVERIASSMVRHLVGTFVRHRRLDGLARRDAQFRGFERLVRAAAPPANIDSAYQAVVSG